MWVGLLIFYVTNETNETNVRPSKSPLKGDFGFPPFKGGAGRVLFLGVLAQQTAKKCSTFAADFNTRFISAC